MSREKPCRSCRNLMGPGALLLMSFHALANPTGGTVTQGSATFSTSGSQFTINQSSAYAAINWSSFNIAQGETTTFVQPSATSVAWNQINDVNPSQILGNLDANGYVILQNPNGFYIGGQAAITAHGLVMTTANTPPPNFSSGGPWTFDAPPPSAEIQNFGQINITGGGAAYLIASDIVNNGTISAPNGQIGLYDGETVLVSTTPNGQGLSAEVTLPQGSVDNEGQLTALGGSVVAQAQFVNQNGVIQANTAANVNGSIELLGSSSVTLGASSSVSATGDSTASSPSAGGSVQIQAGTSFSDTSGSSINVSGATQGGNAGQISISAPQMSALNSTLNGQAAAGYLNGTLSIGTSDIALNSDGSPVANTLALNVNSLSSGFSQINLQASDDITLDTPWTLAVNGGIPSSVLLQAGNEITLDSGSEIQADGGNITLKAPTVDQAGTLEADSVGGNNGVIEVDASQDLILGASSTITANGDPTATTTASPGGFVVVNAGSSYSDAAGSAISVAGTAGGQGGIVEIFDPQIGATPIETAVSGAFQYLVNPYDMTLSGSATGTSTDNGNLEVNFNLNDLAAYSGIDLQALDDITLSSLWALNNSSVPAALSLTAGNDITLDNGSAIGYVPPGESGQYGQNWSVNLTAGTGFIPTVAQPTPASGSDGVYLNGLAYIQTQNGNINVLAVNEVQINDNPDTASSPSGDIGNGIRTVAGGNIDVTTQYGDVNTGANSLGFDFSGNPLTIDGQTLYYEVDPSLGGISTEAGGNVTISAGGNVYSYVPETSSTADAGTGAFGPEPGNVTITAGGSVYGHYVLANGVGTITAGVDAGASSGGGDTFALSLVDGTWSVNANGNIYLQEVRNPNGVFNDLTGSTGGKHGHIITTGQYLFNYGQDAAVDLNAGDGVYLTDEALPRPGQDQTVPGDYVPVLYPPILDITAGTGGVTLQGNVGLFPSPDQSLSIITTDDGSLTSDPNTPGTIPVLYMSDSGNTQWSQNSTAPVFGDTDHGTLADEPTDPNPVIIDISGNIGSTYVTTVDGQDVTMYNGVTLLTTKATDITVGGNMYDSGFSGQNLQGSDITSINVAGQIYNQSPYTFEYNVDIPSVPEADLLPGLGISWDDIFYLALNPADLNDLVVQPNWTPSEYLADAVETYSLFGVQQLGSDNWTVTGGDQGFFYNPTTQRLGFVGPMSSSTLSDLTSGTYTVLELNNGVPETYTANGQTYFKTTTVSWVAPSTIQSLFIASQADPEIGSGELGLRIGGPGEFDVNAGSIELGNSYGILSCGVYDTSGGFDRYNNLASITPSGATVNVTVSGDLTMLTSTIATLGGGDVNVISTGGSMDLGSQELISSAPQLGFGIYTVGPGDVNVEAFGDVDIDGSRIASYDGGDITVESLTGDVDVGTGGDALNSVVLNYVSPITGSAVQYSESTFGSGIVAFTLEPGPASIGYPPADFGAATVPGNITVNTPEGDITASLGGILQQALDGSVTAGPLITLTAGTPYDDDWNSSEAPLYVGNIDLGTSGVIGGSVDVKATGSIEGLVISRQNSDVQALQSFTGTILAGGQANVSATTVSGTIAGIGGVNVSGNSSSASLLGQNVSVNGGAAQSTLGSSASATSSSQSATQTANSQAQQQVASDETGESDDNKKKKSEVRKVGRVTVILSAAVPE